jgi:hypothetical protein
MVESRQILTTRLSKNNYPCLDSCETYPSEAELSFDNQLVTVLSNYYYSSLFYFDFSETKISRSISNGLTKYPVNSAVVKKIVTWHTRVNNLYGISLLDKEG